MNDADWGKYERQLFKETSLIPDAKIDPNAALDLHDIVSSYLQNVETIIRRTPIDAFWQKLIQQPFDRVEIGDNDPDMDEIDDLSRKAKVLGGAMARANMIRDGIPVADQAWRFTEIQTPSGQIPSWALPSFRLGEIAFPVSIMASPIPDALADRFRPEAFGVNPLDDYSNFSFEEHEFHGIFALFLGIRPNAVGSLRYELTWELTENKDGDHRICFPVEAESLVALDDREYSAWKSIEIEEDAWLGIIVEGEAQKPTLLIDDWHCLNRDWLGRYTHIERRDIDDDHLELLCRMPFRSSLPIVENVSLPIPPDTVIEALLLNEAVENVDDRLSRRIAASCTEIVKNGMAHYQSMNDTLDLILNEMVSDR
jgi:hypothetical protein